MPNLTDLIGCDCTRRAFLGRAAAGIGTMALASLLNPLQAGASVDRKSLASLGPNSPAAVTETSVSSTQSMAMLVT